MQTTTNKAKQVTESNKEAITNITKALLLIGSLRKQA